MAGAVALYRQADGQIKTANENRLASMLLADELRQTSDDLTRLGRTYIATGKATYKQQYKDVVDIRAGRKARRSTTTGSTGTTSQPARPSRARTARPSRWMR